MRSAPVVIRGSQQPRVESVPDGQPHGDAQDILDLAEAAGLGLDPWQSDRLEKSLRRRAGRWAAFEVAVVAPRQNGKNALLEARQLGGLFILRRRLQIHSSHQVDTSLEAFRRLLFLIENNDWLLRDIRHIRRTNGQEEIETKHGCRIRFRTRSKGGGRGFSADDVYFDEAMIFPEVSLGAIMPVVSAMPDPQLWYTASAVDQTIHEDGIVLARLRARGMRGGDPSLAYFEYSAAGDNPEDVPPAVAMSEETWAQANPALNIRITSEHVANEQRSMDPRTFAVERLGVGDWPDLAAGNNPISPEKWANLEDAHSIPVDPVVFSLDTAPNRTWTTLSVAGKRADGLFHVETVDRRRGTEWVVAALADRVARNRPSAVIFDGAGPVAALLPELQRQQMGANLVATTAGEHGKACGVFFDAVEQEKLRHLGTPELAAAIRGAVTRPLGDAWAWSRKTSSVDITPLVAATLALWGVASTVDAAPWVGWK
jgi:hypothetical protein